MIDVSVILPTLNRKIVLLETIQHLEQQVYQGFEVIVVDQSDVPIGKAAFSEFTCPVQYIHLPFKDLPEARNIGIKNSRGEILLFIDDDVIPDKYLIQRHVFHYKDLRIGGVGGKVIEDPDIYTNSRSIIGVKVTLGGRTLRNLNTDQKGFTWSLLGCNMSFRRKAVEEVGDFDSRFLGTAVFEETDYCYRLRAKGYKIYFEPDASLVHLLFQKEGCREANEVKQAYYSFHNSVLFYLKNMPRVTLPYFLFVAKLKNIANVLLRKYGWVQSFAVLKGLWDGFKTYSRNKDKA